MFGNAKKTLALAAALAAVLPMTAFADPHHDHGNRDNKPADLTTSVISGLVGSVF